MSEETVSYWQAKDVQKYDLILSLVDPEGFYVAEVKSDGCIDLRRYYNTPLNLRTTGVDDDEPDYLHICDIDDMIKRLEALRDQARAHFGEDWR